MVTSSTNEHKKRSQHRSTFGKYLGQMSHLLIFEKIPSKQTYISGAWTIAMTNWNQLNRLNEWVSDSCLMPNEQYFSCITLWWKQVNYTPAPPEGGVYCFTSVRPSVRPKIFFITFFSATIDGRNLIFGHKLHIGTPYRGKRQGYDKWALAHSSSCFQWDDEKARIVLDKNAELDFCSASSLKQQFSGTYVVLLTHIIMIHSQPVFVLAPWFCLLSG